MTPAASNVPSSLPSAPEAGTEAGQSPWREAWRRLRKNRLAFGGGLTLVALILCCFLGPLFSQSFREMDLAIANQPPDGAHWMGTDYIGRDLLARILYGGRISFMVGFVGSVVALTIGVTYGAVSGWCGGRIDALMMRIVEIIYALPFTVFVILLMVFLKDPMQRFDAWLTQYPMFADWRGAGKILMMFAAIGAVEWLTMARIVRGQVMAIKKMEYIEAARSMGFGPARILGRHLLPNALGPIIVYATLTIPGVMMLESFLSFLGLGVDAPMSSLGTLIHDGADRMEECWWQLVFPGVVFSLALFSLNFLGDGLRDALDVRTAKD
jgi:oligopeptide transport system permease protein